MQGGGRRFDPGQLHHLKSRGKLQETLIGLRILDDERVRRQIALLRLSAGDEKAYRTTCAELVKNLDDGQMYMGKITLNDANSITLDGCVMGGAICKGETWTRVK